MTRRHAREHATDNSATTTTRANGASPPQKRRRQWLLLLLPPLMHPLTLCVCTLLVRLLCYGYRDVLEQRTTPQPPFGYPSLQQQQQLLYTAATNTDTAAAAAATTSVRATYYGVDGRALTPLHPLRFAVVAPAVEANTWRELLFWRRMQQHNNSSNNNSSNNNDKADATTPYHLLALAPWYVASVPLWLLRGRVRAVAWLSACDALTAMLIARWPSCNAALLYTLLVCNPLVVYATVYESLTSLELLLMTIALECVRRRGRCGHATRRCASSSPSSWQTTCCRGLYTLLGLSAVALLGSEFVALAVAMLFPVGTRDRRAASVAAAAMLCGVGVVARAHMHRIRVFADRTSLYAPPDWSATWYARQVVLPAFARLFELVHVQVPAIMTTLLAFVTPSSTTATATAASDAATSPPRRARDVAPLFDDAAVMVAVFALLLSVYMRSHLTLPCVCVSVLFLYSAVNPHAHATMRVRRAREGRDDGVVTRSPHTRVRIILPCLCVLMLVPLQCAMYYAWVVYNVANGNTLLFCQVLFMMMAALFIAVWYGEVVADAVALEDMHASSSSNNNNNNNSDNNNNNNNHSDDHNKDGMHAPVVAHASR